MKTKQIIIVIVIFFFALILFKSISSGIQEDKEISVLREKARIEEVKNAPLNKCISDAEIRANSDMKDNIVFTYTIFSDSYKNCMKPTGHGSRVESLIASGEMTLKDYCAPPTPQKVELEKQKIKNIEKEEKEECYKRYK